MAGSVRRIYASMKPESELLPPDPQPTFGPKGMPHMKKTETQLAKFESAGAVNVRREFNPADMMQQMVEKGITAENVAAFTELVKLSEHVEDRHAKRLFAESFLELQKELPIIQGYRTIPDKQGRPKFAYANFEDIDAIVRPICLRHGFTYAFHESAVENGRTTVVMTLQHSGGHAREIPYSVRAGSGPYGASESQADVSGHTYAQRGAIEAGLSLRIIGNKEDARMEGGPITAEQADELEKRVALLNQDHGRFLKWLQAASYAEIPSGKYAMADQFLAKRERENK